MLRAIARTLLITGALAGCYVYTPAPRGQLPGAGEEMRAVLTDAGTAAMAPLLGDGVGYIEGRLVAASDTAVTLAVTSTTTRGGSSAGWTNEKVSVRRDYIAGFEQKTLSRSRSVGFGAAALATVVGSFVAMRGAAGSSGASGGGGGTGHQ